MEAKGWFNPSRHGFPRGDYDFSESQYFGRTVLECRDPQGKLIYKSQSRMVRGGSQGGDLRTRTRGTFETDDVFSAIEYPEGE